MVILGFPGCRRENFPLLPFRMPQDVDEVVQYLEVGHPVVLGWCVLSTSERE